MDDAIPTEHDWHDGTMIRVFGLDWQNAKSTLFGKPRAKLEHMLGAMYPLSEHFYYMPTPVLEYYLPAYLDYLYSERSRDDSDHASAFLDLAESQARAIKRLSPELQHRVRQTVEHVASNQAKYSADPTIYGSFESRGAKAAIALRMRHW
ncbi:MAG: hypothetical protein ACTS3F_01200 [Phycisphaerales bacterium]